MGIHLTDRGRRVIGGTVNALTLGTVNLDLKSDSHADKINQYVGGMSAYKSDNPLIQSNYYKAVVWVYNGISKLADTISGIPLEARRITGSGPDADFETIYEGPEYDIFNRPNPDTTKEELFAKIVADALLCGESFLAIEPIIGDSFNGVFPQPLEIYHRLAKYMEVLHGKGEQLIGGYRYSEGGGKTIYSAYDIIHIRLPNPNKHFHGQSAVEPSKDVINLQHSVIELQNLFFKNCPVMGIGLATDQSLSEEAINQLRAQVKEKYTGGSRFEPPILHSGLKTTNLIEGVSSIDFKQIDENAIIATLGALGVPPAIVGMLRWANYSNMRTQWEIFYDRVKHMGRYIEAAINLRLPRRFGQDNLIWRFNYSKIDARQEDRKARAERTALLWNAGIITHGEARESEGYEPDPETENDYKTNANPLASLFGGDSGSDGSSSAAKGEDGKPARASTLKGLDPTPENIFWLKFDKARTHTEGGFGRLVQKLFRDQKKRVLAKFDDITDGGKILFPLWREVKDDAPDDASSIFPPTDEMHATHDDVRPFVSDAVRLKGQQIFSSLGIDGSFDVSNPEVIKFIENTTSKLAERVTGTTWEKIRQVLKSGYEEGQTAREVRDELVKLFDGWYKPAKGQMGVGPRCQLIARTEMGRVTNGGQYQAHSQAINVYGLKLEKVWLHSLSGNPRPDHVILDGVAIPFDQKFDVGGELADFPCDGNLSAAQCANCRCTYITREKKE